ncbi:MAG: histidine triad nucleotide-binding protein [Tetrasphaera sp.]
MSSDCLFCKFVTGELAADIVGESETSLAFRDIAPQAPVHVLVVPKRHVENAAELASSAEELADVVRLAAAVADSEGVAGAYRLVTNTGKDGGQAVFHMHLHLLGGRRMTWPPG